MDPITSSQLPLAVIIALLRVFRSRRALQLGVLISTIALLSLSLAVTLGGHYWFTPWFADGLERVVPPVAVLCGFLLLVCLISYTSFEIRPGGQLGIELESIRHEREQITERLTRDSEGDVIGTIQLSLNQLAEYYTINKSQARNSFNVSVGAIVVGLITLLTGAWLLLAKKNPNIQMATITGISGVLIQFIGGAYFVLYRHSLAQLNRFYEQLLRTQYMMLAIRLCSEVDDSKEKTRLTGVIVTALIRRSTETISDAQMATESCATTTMEPLLDGDRTH